MLRIDKKIGECEIQMNNGEFVKSDIYSCNALFAIVSKDKHNLYMFYADLEHLKRCLGLRKNYNNIVNGTIKNCVFFGKGKTTYGTSYETIVSNLNKGGITAAIAV